MKLLITYSLGNDPELIERRKIAQWNLTRLIKGAFSVELIVSQVSESQSITHRNEYTSVDWIPDWSKLSTNGNNVPRTIDPAIWMDPAILWGLINMPKFIESEFITVIAVENSVIHVMLCSLVIAVFERHHLRSMVACGHLLDIDPQLNSGQFKPGSIVISPYPLPQFGDNSKFYS